MSLSAAADGQDLHEAQDPGAGLGEDEASPAGPDDQAHEADSVVSLADVDDTQAPQLVGDELAAVIGEQAAARLEADARTGVLEGWMDEDAATAAGQLNPARSPTPPTASSS